MIASKQASKQAGEHQSVFLSSGRLVQTHISQLYKDRDLCARNDSPRPTTTYRLPIYICAATNNQSTQEYNRRATAALYLSHTSSFSPPVAATMEMNGETGAKRKYNPVPVVEHPAKHPKPETSSTLTPGDSTPANGTVFNVDHTNELDPSSSAPLHALGSSQPDSPEWQATIEKVVKCVVSIRFCQTCAFDTELSMDSEATGFVVDAERGYILTNRHVVCAGPFWGYCIFDNHEEVRQLCKSHPLLLSPPPIECR